MENENEKSKKIENLNILANKFIEIPETGTKLHSHASFVYDFSPTHSSIDIIKKVFLLDFNSSSYFPVTTDVKMINENQIEVQRSLVYYDYIYREAPLQRILIKRDSDECVLNIKNDNFKKEVYTINKKGQFQSMVKFKVFRNPNELLFLQNVYYYRCILMVGYFLDEVMDRRKKKEFKLNDLFYYEILKNMF